MADNSCNRNKGTIVGCVLDIKTAGQRVNLPQINCKEVTIIAKRNNKGNIYIGGDDVSSANYGVALAVLDSFTFVTTNTSFIYLDADISGEGVSYVAI